MGFWGKAALALTMVATAVTSAPQYLWNVITEGKDAADRSLLDQMFDPSGGGGNPILPEIPPDEIEVPITIVQPTIWDNLSVILSDPLNLLILGFLIVGGAYLVKALANKVFGRSA